MKKQIKLMAEYGGEAVWWMGHRAGVVDVQELPITDELRNDIKRWADVYADTLEDNDPVVSGFESDEARDKYDAEGRVLWKRLQEELSPDWDVYYLSESDQKLLAPGHDGTLGSAAMAVVLLMGLVAIILSGYAFASLYDAYVLDWVYGNHRVAAEGLKIESSSHSQITVSNGDRILKSKMWGYNTIMTVAFPIGVVLIFISELMLVWLVNHDLGYRILRFMQKEHVRGRT